MEARNTIKIGDIQCPGEDTLSGTNYDYALWQAEQAVTINLKEGWAEDGFGTRDNVSGIVTIHGSRFDDTVYGTENFEKFFANGGDNIFIGGGGGDKITYAPSPGGSAPSRVSTNYTITKIGDERVVTRANTNGVWPNFLVWSPPWLYASSVKKN